MAIFRRRLSEDVEALGEADVAPMDQDAGRRGLSASSTLAAAALFAAAGMIGGFLAVAQAPDAGFPVPEAGPTVANDPGRSIAPPERVTFDRLAEAEEAPTFRNRDDLEDIILTSQSIDHQSGRPGRAAILGQSQADPETCRANLQGAAERLTIRFAAGSIDPEPEDLEAAFSFAEGVASCPNIRILVRGHADPTGDETENLVLSWERAEAVIAAITASGHDRDAYEPAGFGSRQLISAAATREAEALNRRVDFVVVERRL